MVRRMRPLRLPRPVLQFFESPGHVVDMPVRVLARRVSGPAEEETARSVRWTRRHPRSQPAHLGTASPPFVRSGRSGVLDNGRLRAGQLELRVCRQDGVLHRAALPALLRGHGLRRLSLAQPREGSPEETQLHAEAPLEGSQGGPAAFGLPLRVLRHLPRPVCYQFL